MNIRVECSSGQGRVRMWPWRSSGSSQIRQQAVTHQFEIYIVIISDVPTVKGVPDFLSVFVVLIGNSLLAETAVEFVL